MLISFEPKFDMKILYNASFVPHQFYEAFAAANGILPQTLNKAYMHCFKVNLSFRNQFVFMKGACNIPRSGKLLTLLDYGNMHSCVCYGFLSCSEILIIQNPFRGAVS